MIRIAYVSHAASADPETRALPAILEASIRNNKKARLTGGLLISRGRFFQVLEGRREDVDQTFERIRRDTRHSDVRVVWSGEAAGRLFDGWAMVAAHVSPAIRLNIDRVIDEAEGYPHAAVSALHQLLTTQPR